MNKNIDLLRSFIAYCVSHPDQRFWQALRNWSGHNFIYVGSHAIHEYMLMRVPGNGTGYLRETFNYEGKDH